MQMAMVHVARWSLILAAIALSPVYAVWVFGGWLYDQRDRRRHAALISLTAE